MHNCALAFDKVYPSLTDMSIKSAVKPLLLSNCLTDIGHLYPSLSSQSAINWCFQFLTPGYLLDRSLRERLVLKIAECFRVKGRLLSLKIHLILSFGAADK